MSQRSLPYDYDNLSDAFEAVEDMNENNPPAYIRTINDEPPVAIDGDHEFMDATERSELCARLERNAEKKAAKQAA